MAILQTPWDYKAVEALKLNGKSERTQEAYAGMYGNSSSFIMAKIPT